MYQIARFQSVLPTRVEVSFYDELKNMSSFVKLLVQLVLVIRPLLLAQCSVYRPQGLPKDDIGGDLAGQGIRVRLLQAIDS